MKEEHLEPFQSIASKSMVEQVNVAVHSWYGNHVGIVKESGAAIIARRNQSAFPVVLSLALAYPSQVIGPIGSAKTRGLGKIQLQLPQSLSVPGGGLGEFKTIS